MFAAELVGGNHARSSALQADAVDFLADSANYAVSLFVVGAALRRRATAAFLKGLSMLGLGAFVLVMTVTRVLRGELPQHEVMGVLGIAAIAANAVVLVLLLSYRHGDANRRSVWICTRNDIIGNVAVLGAATGVFASHSLWPDALVGIVMACLGLMSGWQICRLALAERRLAVAIVALLGCAPFIHGLDGTSPGHGRARHHSVDASGVCSKPGQLT